MLILWAQWFGDAIFKDKSTLISKWCADCCAKIQKLLCGIKGILYFSTLIQRGQLSGKMITFQWDPEILNQSALVYHMFSSSLTPLLKGIFGVVRIPDWISYLVWPWKSNLFKCYYAEIIVAPCCANLTTLISLKIMALPQVIKQFLQWN